MSQNIVIVILVAIIIVIIYITGSSEEIRDALNNYVMRQQLSAVGVLESGVVTIREEPVGTMIEVDLEPVDETHILTVAPHGGNFEIDAPYAIDESNPGFLASFDNTAKFTTESKVTLRGNRNALGKTLLLIAGGKIVDFAPILLMPQKMNNGPN